MLTRVDGDKQPPQHVPDASLSVQQQRQYGYESVIPDASLQSYKQRRSPVRDVVVPTAGVPPVQLVPEASLQPTPQQPPGIPSAAPSQSPQHQLPPAAGPNASLQPTPQRPPEARVPQPSPAPYPSLSQQPQRQYPPSAGPDASLHAYAQQPPGPPNPSLSQQPQRQVHPGRPSQAPAPPNPTLSTAMNRMVRPPNASLHGTQNPTIRSDRTVLPPNASLHGTHNLRADAWSAPPQPTLHGTANFDEEFVREPPTRSSAGPMPSYTSFDDSMWEEQPSLGGPPADTHSAYPADTHSTYPSTREPPTAVPEADAYATVDELQAVQQGTAASTAELASRVKDQLEAPATTSYEAYGQYSELPGDDADGSSSDEDDDGYATAADLVDVYSTYMQLSADSDDDEDYGGAADVVPSRPTHELSAAESAALAKHLQEATERALSQTTEWNTGYQALYSQPAATPRDLQVRAERLQQLVSAFEHFCSLVARVIVEQEVLPEAQRPISPATSMGGIAGGSKYISGGVLFKFASADLHGIYGSDESAAKASSNEVRHMNAVIDSDVPHLHTTLSALVYHRGHAIYCTALAPLGPGDVTLVYGSSDAGRTIRDESAPMRSLIDTLADTLGVAKHTVRTRDGERTYELRLGADVEGHLSSETGRFFLLDLARLLPPTPPRKTAKAYFGDFLYRMFRPEYLRAHCLSAHKQLSSDAFSNFQDRDDAVAHHKRVLDAYDKLHHESIPAAAAALLDTAGKSDAPLTSAQISSTLHTHGVNMRYLGHVRACIDDAPLRHVLLSEMACRALKNQLRHLLRQRVTSRDQEQRTLTRWMRNVLQLSPSVRFWQSLVKPLLVSKYVQASRKPWPHKAVLSDEDVDALRVEASSPDTSGAFVTRLCATASVLAWLPAGTTSTPLPSTDVHAALAQAGGPEVLFTVETRVKTARVSPFVRLEEAEERLLTSLRMRTEVLGKNHRALATDLLSLIRLYQIWKEEEPTASFERGAKIIDQLIELYESHRADTPLPEDQSLEEKGTWVEEVWLGGFETASFFYQKFGHFEQALELRERDLERRARVYGEESGPMARGLSNKGNLLGLMLKHKPQAEILKRALELKQRVFGERHPEAAMTSLNLAVARGQLEQHEEMRQLLEDLALPVTREHLGTNHPQYAHALNNLGYAYTRLGNVAKAKEIYAEALEVRRNIYGSDHFQCANTMAHLAKVHALESDFARMHELMQQALEINESHFGPRHPELANTLSLLAYATANLGRKAEAGEQLKRAISISEAARGKDGNQEAESLRQRLEML